MDASALELDAVKFAQLAVQRDQNGRYQEAVFYYKVCGGGRPGGGRIRRGRRKAARKVCPSPERAA